MKKALSAMALVACLSAPAFSAQAAQSVVDYSRLASTLSQVQTFDLINWKVGDSQDYNVTMASLPVQGTMHKEVTKDDGATIWVTEDLNMQIQQENVQTQINKADGKILKTIVNGQDQQVPDENPQIISQDYTQITVPAGTFKCLHVVAKTKDVSKLEVWANPTETVMEGSLKQAMTTQYGDITMELTAFKKGQ